MLPHPQGLLPHPRAIFLGLVCLHVTAILSIPPPNKLPLARVITVSDEYIVHLCSPTPLVSPLGLRPYICPLQNLTTILSYLLAKNEANRPKTVDL